MSNQGGGPRWATMPRGVCCRCGLEKPVGVLQGKTGFRCRNTEKCAVRAAKKAAKEEKQQKLIDDGIIGTCQSCGRVLRICVPAGGDGSQRVLIRHNVKEDSARKRRCFGSRMPAEEWK